MFAFIIFPILSFYISTVSTSSPQECFKLDVSITQKIENEGFHRNLLWLVEMQHPKGDVWRLSNCNLSLVLEVNAGFFVNPDELNELVRKREISALIKGEVNIETPAHDSEGHTVYMFLPQENVEKISLALPIHLRYQRAQITGGFGKIYLKKPSLLAICPNETSICGKQKKLKAPCKETGEDLCMWRNMSYHALFDDLDLFVPIGDLDDYPLVSIFTLLLGCAGCIYILSILSSAPI